MIGSNWFLLVDIKMKLKSITTYVSALDGKH